MKIVKAAFVTGVTFVLVSMGGPVRAMPLNDETVGQITETILFGSTETSDAGLRLLAARGKPDVVPALILALRFRRNDSDILGTISGLAGKPMKSWRDAMLWQEANPQIMPHPSFRKLKIDAFNRIDPRFMRFLGGDKSRRENLKIRLEEIVWGGVKVDGIPSLDNPKLVSAADAGYVRDDDLVFGVEINGDARAYPLRIMGWHEMFNDVIGGVPVALAYCTLCGAGILFETGDVHEGKTLVFGSSGFLYRSNKLMFDRQTDSLWNQFTGEPVSGTLKDAGIKLKIRPVVITTWQKWEARHPATKVLSLDTGHSRNYGSGVVYRDYFASPSLMFPTIVRDETQVKRKDYVFGIRDVGAAKAWPVTAFAREPVINDTVGSRPVVLIGDVASRTVRAYERGTRTFSAGKAANVLEAAGVAWKITEDRLIGPDGATLARVPGHISYWFAWDGYLGVASDLYGAAKP
ncbi:MAG: hypothetical protein ACI9JL_000308 [Paracoccaceae bacterium]|jgi:hypothetical protein